MGGMHASRLSDALEKLEVDSTERASVKHAMISRARESGIFEHLRRERVLTPEGCFVKSGSKYVERAASLLGSEKSKFVSTPLAASDRND